jgi:hypothetical protein
MVSRSPLLNAISHPENCLAAGVSGSWDWAAAGSNAAVTKTIKISFSLMI